MKRVFQRLGFGCLLIQGVLLLFCALPDRAGEADAAGLLDLTNALKLRLWDYSFDAGAALGYKDNVLLSHTNRQASLFAAGHADMVVFRLPADGWMSSFLVSGEDSYYFGGRINQDEESAVAMGQVIRYFDSGWSSTAGAVLSYQNQVLDLSTIEPGQAGASRVVAETARGRWSLKRDFGPNWAELELAAGRQILQAPLDSFWQEGPRLALGRKLGTQAELSLDYRWNRLAYDTRPEVTAGGTTITNSHLRLSTHAMTLAWKQAWDAQARWSSTLGFNFEADADNGAGYFSVYQYALTPTLEYRGAAWKCSVTLKAGYLDFPVQMVGTTNSAAFRSKVALGAAVRVERQVTRALKFSATYSLDRSRSNLALDDYLVNVITLGAEFRF